MQVAQKVKTKSKLGIAIIAFAIVSFLAGFFYFVEEFSVKYAGEVVKKEMKHNK